MRSVRIGNLVICKHVFDNYADRFPEHAEKMNFDRRDHRIIVARFIKEAIDNSVKVPRENGQTIFVYIPVHFPAAATAFPAEIGPSIIKIMTCYPAGQSLVNKAKLRYQNVDRHGKRSPMFAARSPQGQ